MISLGLKKIQHYQSPIRSRNQNQERAKSTGINLKSSSSLKAKTKSSPANGTKNYSSYYLNKYKPPKPAWKHDNEAILKGICNYTVKVNIFLAVAEVNKFKIFVSFSIWEVLLLINCTHLSLLLNMQLKNIKIQQKNLCIHHQLLY